MTIIEMMVMTTTEMMAMIGVMVKMIQIMVMGT